MRGTVAFSGANREMRYDTRHGTTVRPSVERVNLYLTGERELTSTLSAFGEVGFFGADSKADQPPVVNLNASWIPASNYYNPFGPTTFANGTPNPNRLPNLVNVPAQGLPVRLGSYRFVDAGFQDVDVKNYQSRFVAGLRGEWGADYTREVNTVNNLLATAMPVELSDLFVNGRLADGSVIGTDPRMIRWLRGLASDFPSLTGPTDTEVKGDAGRLAEILKFAAEKPDDYDRDHTLQAEHRAILERQSRGGRGRAA